MQTLSSGVGPLFGSAAELQDRYARRYYPAQRRYRDEARPEQRAHAIVENDDFLHPGLIFAERERQR